MSTRVLLEICNALHCQSQATKLIQLMAGQDGITLAVCSECVKEFLEEE